MLGSAYCWLGPNNGGIGEHMTIDGGAHQVFGVVTQGCGAGSDRWVTAFKVAVSVDGDSFEYVDEAEIFPGNSDTGTKAYHYFRTPYTARYVRFHPIMWSLTSYLALRAGLLVSPALPSLPPLPPLSPPSPPSLPPPPPSQPPSQASPTATPTIATWSLGAGICTGGDDDWSASDSGAADGGTLPSWSLHAGLGWRYCAYGTPPTSVCVQECAAKTGCVAISHSGCCFLYKSDTMPCELDSSISGYTSYSLVAPSPPPLSPQPSQPTDGAPFASPAMVPTVAPADSPTTQPTLAPPPATSPPPFAPVDCETAGAAQCVTRCAQCSISEGPSNDAYGNDCDTCQPCFGSIPCVALSTSGALRAVVINEVASEGNAADPWCAGASYVELCAAPALPCTDLALPCSCSCLAATPPLACSQVQPVILRGEHLRPCAHQRRRLCGGFRASLSGPRPSVPAVARAARVHAVLQGRRRGPCRRAQRHAPARRGVWLRL